MKHDENDVWFLKYRKLYIFKFYGIIEDRSCE